MPHDRDERDVLAFLDAAARGGRDSPVEVITTHISHVVLAGDRVFAEIGRITLLRACAQ